MGLSGISSKEVDKLSKKYRIYESEIDKFNDLKGDFNKFNLIEERFITNSISKTSIIEYENEITLDKTKAVVKTKLTMPNSKKMVNIKYVDEVEKLISNAFEAYKYFQDIQTIKDINIQSIKGFHYNLMKKIRRIDAGYYRQFECTIVGKENIVNFTLPQNIESDMNDFTKIFETLEEDLRGKSNIEKLNKLLDIKRRFIAIHPFEDGNGRTSRALLQLLLKLCNLPMTCFDGWNREDYHTAMHIAYVSNATMNIVKSMYLNEILNNPEYKNLITTNMANISTSWN